MGDAQIRLQQLGKILALEARQGYEDRAMIGGLEAFIAKLSQDIGDPIADALQQHIQNYQTKSHPERVNAVRELLDVLKNPSVGVSVPEVPVEQAQSLTRDVETEAAPSSSSEETIVPPPSNFEVPGLDATISYAKGVGARREKALQKLGIKIIEDLLIYFPRRIEDRTQTKKIAQIRDGDRVTIVGSVRAMDTVKPRPNFEILKVAIQDGTGILYAVWFNQSWLKTQMKSGQKISMYGEVSHEFGQIQMSNPTWEPAEQGLFTGRLVPIYPSTKGVQQSALIRMIRDNVVRYKDRIEEILPEPIRKREGLLPRSEAIASIHFPKSIKHFEQARNTLAFEELFLFQLGVALHRSQTEAIEGRSLEVEDDAFDEFEMALPFKLTGAQRRSINEIRKDMASLHPMNRLLQGDVGSGKTIVAAAACFIAIKAGYQACMMAPTEILAQQHMAGLKDLLEPMGIRCGLMIGSLKESEKREIRELMKLGMIDLLIGTHALIEDSIEFKKPGVVVIDEQHRFGVIQRARLEKKGENLDVLVMSATPIPRTIMLTLYGQFEVSILDELPFEKQIRTYWIAEDKRHEVYDLVSKEVEKGVQAYVVYPLVEESETMELRAATQMKEELEHTFFKNFNVGLLHGRMKEAEKREVMRALRAKEIQILVSTTVVEVGIDVPDASLMVIEHAERFGLSQLHQLRGRIGRAGQSSLCFAIGTAKTDDSRARLQVFQEHLDGFKIAEADLEIRGPGELLGLAQHGLDTTFRAADLIHDLKLMQRARSEAILYLKENSDTPLLEIFKHRFGDSFELARF